MAVFLGIQLIYVTIAIMKIEIIHDSVDNVKDLNGCYDYIVVGLGTSGSVVANRLAEDPKNRVLGLEAGIYQSVFTDIPPLYAFRKIAFGVYEYDWNFRTVPQTKLGLFLPFMPALRGKVMGGSSTVNLMIYNRGNKKDYDNWAQTYGAIGWDYESVLPYFLKFENNSDNNIVKNNPGYHSTTGPVGISSPANPDSILLQQIRAMNELGFKTVDINGATQSGTTICQNFIKEGLRSSASNSYLEPNPYPNNLFLSPNSYVTKILIENLTAVGVEYSKNNNTYKAYATKEVILSAGAHQSPQLLMLSGIGPREHLNQIGIPVIADLPVGLNLKDHLMLYSIFGLLNDPNRVDFITEADINIPNLYQLYHDKSGLLSQIPSSITYLSTKYNKDPSWPNTALFFDIDRYYSYANNVTNATRLITFSPWVGLIKSVGTVRLNSSNPFDPPLIDPNYLSNEEDLLNFIEILRLAFIVLENSTFSSLVTLTPNPVPGCIYCPGRFIYECDSYLKCICKNLGRSSAHFTGTCRMGSIKRNDVVVDERLRVKGIKRLRVIDCSIMPDIVNSNLNAPALMIGEYGSDMIKADNC